MTNSIQAVSMHIFISHCRARTATDRHTEAHLDHHRLI